MGKSESATKSCLQMVYAVAIVTTLFVSPVHTQPTSNSGVVEQIRAMLNQAGGEQAAYDLLLGELLRQHRLEQASQEVKQQPDMQSRLETRATGGTKRYQGSRRIGGTIILGR